MLQNIKANRCLMMFCSMIDKTSKMDIAYLSAQKDLPRSFCIHAQLINSRLLFETDHSETTAPNTQHHHMPDDTPNLRSS